MEITLQVGRLWRNLAALALVAVACPIALFGGALLGCAAQGMTASCVVNGVLVSPVLLFAAGFGAGLLARGWTGLFIVTLGILAGMVAIPLVASIAGNPVPIDPVQGVIATIWFTPPVLIGYGAGRGLARLRTRGSRSGGSEGA